MEALDAPCLMMDDDLLNFSLLEDEDEDGNKTKNPSSSSSNPNSQDPDDHSRSFHEFAVEELEWLLNKDAFLALETALDIFSPQQNHLSRVSVLENSNSSSNSNNNTIMSYCGTFPVPVSFPVCARSKRRRRRRRGFPELPGQQGLVVEPSEHQECEARIPKAITNNYQWYYNW